MQLETLADFRNRTQGFSQHSLWETEGFTPKYNSLVQKVFDDGSGMLRPFYGNTTVFQLDGETKRTLRRMQDALYARCGDMMAERLEEASFHITLHDLLNGNDWQQLHHAMADVRGRVQAIFPQVLAQLAQPLRMRSTWAFNMGNTSVVLGFEPADEDSCRRLMTMYDCLQQAVPLTYRLTPHVTLGYYRPAPQDKAHLDSLALALAEINRSHMMDGDPAHDGARLEIGLAKESLVYQEFSDMNSYQTYSV